MRRLFRYGLLAALIAVSMLLIFALPASAEGGRVQGFAWIERTVDGVFDNEYLAESVSVTLEKENGTARPDQVASAVTSSSGQFLFDRLEKGTYRLSFQLPKGYCFTLHGQDSCALPASGRFTYSPWFTVENGQTVEKDVGITRSESGITVIAFEDANLNSGRMTSEPHIRNVLIELVYSYEGEEYVVATASTDKQGEATIPSLSPGTYYARALLPEHYVVGPMGEKINLFFNCFRPKEDLTGYTDPFTLEPNKTLGMALGMVRTGSLTGKVWYDANNNGNWDAEETGLTDAVVTLRSTLQPLSYEARPDEQGVYLFEGLQPGDYKLEFALPDGMIFTYPGSSLLSDIAPKGSVGVSVMVDVTTPISPVGAMTASSLSFSLYEDLNLNGAWDEGEPGLAGAEVSAVQGGKTVDRQTTDPDGFVHFSTLRSGDAQIVLSLPEGFLMTPDEGGVFSLTGAQTAADTAVTLDGETEPLLTAAATQACAVRGVLFEDPVNVGLYQEGYALLSGFTVEAVNDQGALIATAETKDGAYTLYPLLPGDYTVRFLLNDPYVAAPYAADQASNANRIQTQTPEYGETDAVSLTPGQAVEGVNGAVFRAGTVDGFVYLEGASGGVRGVKVTLTDENGQPVSDHSYGLTDDSGAFLIKGVLPGTYLLSYTMPSNGAFTQPMTDDETVFSESVAAESGSEIHMPDVYGVYTSVLSGAVITDGEEAVPVRVTVSSLASGDVREITTDESGAFRFGGLRPGSYAVTAELPEGYVFGSQSGGLFSMIPDRQAASVITFDLGDNRLDANLRPAIPVDVKGEIYFDANRSAARDEEEAGVAGRELTLSCGELTFTQTADENGRFAFAQLPPGEYTLTLALLENEILIGIPTEEDNTLSLPVDAQKDASVDLPLLQFASVSGAVWNLDGSLQSVSAVPVTLTDETGAAVAAAETNEQGAFRFEGLLPGDYTLSARLPEGYLFARSQDTGKRDSFVQSQPDGSVTSIPFPVAMGEMKAGMDIGMGAMGELGDRAWLDENGNGLQDLGESNMPGILVELYQHGELIASATTDGYGRYLLSNLYPGEYEMRVTMHKELKPTQLNGDFPLLNSILPQSDEQTVVVPSVIVPSGGQNLHCDLGFVLRKSGEYPAAMSQIPVKDWRPYSER